MREARPDRRHSVIGKGSDAMKSILVTGADGFVGRRLCSVLMDASYPVRGASLDAECARGVPAGADVVRVGSIGPATDWGPALDGIDTVVHLAARVHVMRDCSTDPLAEYRSVNVAATQCLAHAAVRAGVRRLIFLSTIKVLGECTTRSPFSERHQPRPLDPYSVSKLEAENVLRGIAGTSNLEVVILRPPLIYGPCVKGNFLRLMEGIRSGSILPLAGIQNRRSLLGIDNLADLIRTCVENSAAAGETFVVSDGEDISTPDLVRRLAAHMGRRPRMVPFPMSIMRYVARVVGKGDAVDRLCSDLRVDASKARRMLNWAPPVSLEAGLAATVRWFRNERT